MQSNSLVFMSAAVLLLSGTIKNFSALGFLTPCETPNRLPGLCVELQKCNILLDKLIKQESLDFIKASNCGPKNEDRLRVKVCCGTYSDFLNKTETNRVSSSQASPTSSLHPLPENCGRQAIAIDDRIYGGSDTTTAEFPWMARLKHKSKYGFTSYGCSGFLIHSRFVLTAAHCVFGQAIEILGPVVEVEFGIRNDAGEVECTVYGGEIICKTLSLKTNTTVLHENYEPKQHTHDIALIHLRRDVIESEYIKPICLSRRSINQKELWIAGWGKTEKSATSSVQLKVSVPRVDTYACAKQYKQVNMVIQDTQLCAGGVEGRDSCAGDSGGPLMARDNNKLWYAEGIVSYGSGCGRKNWPAVYTNVPMYIDWIIEKIKQST